MKKYILIILSLFFTSCSYTSALSYFDFSKNKIGEYQNIDVKLLWSADIGEGRSFKTGALQPIFFNNNASAHSYGGEVSVNWRLHERWRLQGNYSYQEINVNSNVDFINIDATTGGADRANPQHQVSFRSNYDLSDKVELNLWLRYVGSLPFYNIKEYVTMDAKLGWKPARNVEVFLVGQNLFSKNHRESRSDYIPSLPTRIPRGIYAGATWRFGN